MKCLHFSFLPHRVAMEPSVKVLSEHTTEILSWRPEVGTEVGGLVIYYTSLKT